MAGGYTGRIGFVNLDTNRYQNTHRCTIYDGVQISINLWAGMPMVCRWVEKWKSWVLTYRALLNRFSRL